MIYFDVTKAARSRQRSGLTRVSARLREELGTAACPVKWQGGWRAARDGEAIQPAPADWVLTAELFSEEERPGFGAFLRERRCGLAAIFHDAIPLRHPHITWPRSVARHPSYLKLLADFDRVWAVSEASRSDLEGFWRWQGVRGRAPVDTIPLGADFNGAPRVVERSAPAGARRRPSLLSVGILEPRKNQALLLDVCTALWSDGLEFDLHLAGRVNPHFGARLEDRIRALRREWDGLHHHPAPDDATLARLYSGARASLFPTIAEGCGLPLLESLWLGVPCLCSDLPVLREKADAGGCAPLAAGDPAAWAGGLRRLLTDETFVAGLQAGLARRALPTWAQTAHVVVSALTPR